MLAVAAAAVLLARPSHSSHTQAGAAPSEAPTSAVQPAPATQPTSEAVSTTAHPTPPPASHKFQIPQTVKDLSDRFQTVLGDEATFKVTLGGDADSSNTGGAYIVGTLTTASGATGGFDLQIIPAGKGESASCDDADLATCNTSRQPDGASLAVGSEPLQSVPGGVTNQANLIWRDGTEFLMHVSNARDPKGGSALMGPHPPLTTDQMAKIVTSERW
ncbi:MAG TPA: hypothetical protein VFE19_07520 [Jatrophihabitantaceae bacterium]|nr:hypothetical protein [Jatrophihabitantaceae bacterium]